MKLRRITRLIELLCLMQGSRRYNSTALADEFAVSRRTIFRDLDVLRQAGVPLCFNEDEQSFLVEGRGYLPPPQFTPEEALALMLLCHELGDRRGVPFCGPARTAARKLENSFPRRLRQHLRRVTQAVEIQLQPSNPLTHSDAAYQALLHAVVERRTVRIRYNSFAETREISTRLSPYRLLFSRRSWYVMGRSSLHRGVRTFNIGRIRSIEVLDECYQIPQRFSLDRYLRNAWHLIAGPGPDVKVRIRFQPRVAGNVAEVSWHKTQRVAFNRDGTLDFRATVSGIEEIAWWILGYGDQAEVLEPPELRDLVAGHAQRMAAQYERRGVRTNGAAIVRPRKRTG